MKKRWIILLLILVLALLLGYFYWRVKFPEKQEDGHGSVKVIAVGDSITYGYGVLTTREKDSYPAILARLLGPSFHVENYGLSGRTLQSTTAEPYFQEELAKESLASSPSIVLLMLGTNDARAIYWDSENFYKEYKEAIAKYQALPSTPYVILMAPPKSFLENPDEVDIDDAIIEKDLRPMIQQISEEENLPYIDFYRLTQAHPEWFPDTIHPDTEGNEAMAKAIYQEIAKSGKFPLDLE